MFFVVTGETAFRAGSNLNEIKITKFQLTCRPTKEDTPKIFGSVIILLE